MCAYICTPTHRGNKPPCTNQDTTFLLLTLLSSAVSYLMLTLRLSSICELLPQNALWGYTKMVTIPLYLSSMHMNVTWAFATNLMSTRIPTKWISGKGFDDGAGLPELPLYINHFIYVLCTCALNNKFCMYCLCFPLYIFIFHLHMMYYCCNDLDISHPISHTVIQRTMEPFPGWAYIM